MTQLSLPSLSPDIRLFGKVDTSESGQRLEREGFAQLVEASKLSPGDVGEKVYNKDWYLGARQALELGLVGGLV